MAQEVERRYRVAEPTLTVERLAHHGVTVHRSSRIIDRWFMPRYVRSLTEEEQWFDVEHGLAYRIRKTQHNDGDFDTLLDSKQHTEANDHNTFHEEVMMRGDESEMLKFLEGKEYYNWLTIDKRRTYFEGASDSLAITMDTIDGVKQALGVDTVLEVEYSGDGSRDEALRTIDDFATTIGLRREDLFEKSLTVESMRVLADFSQDQQSIFRSKA